MRLIRSADNPALKHLGRLAAQSRYRRSSGQAVLEGFHLLEACLRHGCPVTAVYIPEHKSTAAETAALLARFPRLNTVSVADGLLGKYSALHDADDIITLIRLPETPPYCGQSDCIVLEGIQNPGNLGTILRSAAAAGIRQVVADAGCADFWAPKVLRSGMGAHFQLNLFARTDLQAWHGNCRTPLLATALHTDSENLYDCDLRPPQTWLFGNEGCGVSQAMLARADRLVHIPMSTGSESLNVAMAATVCLFEQMRQRNSGSCG